MMFTPQYLRADYGAVYGAVYGDIPCRKRNSLSVLGESIQIAEALTAVRVVVEAVC